MIKITVNEYAGDSSQDFNVECDSLTQALTIMAQYYERTLDAEKCEDSENVAQESVETGVKDKVDWSEAPEWATMYTNYKSDVNDKIWTNGKVFVFESCYKKNKKDIPVNVHWEIKLKDVIAKREL